LRRESIQKRRWWWNSSGRRMRITGEEQEGCCRDCVAITPKSEIRLIQHRLRVILKTC
jgi:hypothetical protein